MINNEMKQVTLYTYADGVDDYGQPRRGTSTTSSIDMYFKVYSQSNVDNPKYVDVELLGLTKSQVGVKNTIEIDNVMYDVLFVTPSKRYNEVFLRKA